MRFHEKQKAKYARQTIHVDSSADSQAIAIAVGAYCVALQPTN